MKTVGSRELKNRLGRYLGMVGRGETIFVTDRGKPVARLLPPVIEGSGPRSTENLLKRLEAEGHLRRRSKGKLKAIKPIVTRGKAASIMVMEDRE